MASKKIKGITIEIDGDTTKLGKALESAENSSKSLQSELKGVNSLLKLDPSNVELLTQKQQLLTDSISSTEDKLKTLKSTQAQVQAQFDKGDITAEQFRDFQREIVATEQKLESLKKQSKDFGSVFEQQMKVASESVKEVGTKIEDAGKKVSGFSAVASGGLIASAKSASDTESAINKYIGSTGKAVSETENYKAIMEDIYRSNYGESIEDVADKMRIVSNILGDLPDDELQRVVEKSYMLEDAYGMDFQENVRGVNALMDQFGITADQAYELINQGAQKGLNQNQDLTDQIAEYSTYYAKLGFDAEDFFNMMISGAESGAYQIDYLNDAMKEFGIRTKDNSTSTNDAYKALGLNVEEINNKFAQGGQTAQEAFAQVTQSIMAIEDPVKRNEVGVALFGTKFEDLEESAVFAMTSAKDQVNMLGDTVNQTSETMYGGTGNKAQEALRSIESAFASLGETLLPIIAPILEKIAELATKFSEMNPIVQNIILIITGLVAVLGPVLLFIGNIVTAIGTLMPVIGAVGTFLSATLMPILTAIGTFITGTIVPGIMAVVTALGWPVIAVMAIIGVIVLLWNKCEWFRDAIKALWGAIKKAFQVAINWISNAVKSIGKFFSDLWSGIKKTFSVVGSWFSDIFSKAVSGIKNAFSSVGKFFQNIWSGIQKAFGNVTNWFKNVFSKAWTAVKNVFSTGGKIFDGIKDGIASTFKTVVNGIIGGINKVISVPFSAINSALKKIKNISIAGAKPFSFLPTISTPQIPKLSVGTNFVPYDEMPALLHKGEQVIPEKYNPEINNKYQKEALFDALTEFTNTRTQRVDSRNGIGELTRLMKQFMPQILENMNQEIVLDDRTLVGKIAPRIDKQLGIISANKSRGY